MLSLQRLAQIPLLQPNFPFRPQAFPIFYGWVILVVTTIGTLMSVPGQTAGVSVFTDPLIEATGLSRLGLSNAYLIGTLTSGLLLPLGGRVIDRVGARLVVIISSLSLGLTLVYLGWSPRLALWLGSSLSLDPIRVAFGVLCLGFVCLRFSGQGMLTLVSRTTLGKWFDRQRGLAAGIAGVFVSFGFSAAPLVLSLFIGGLGWRGAWFCLALSVGIGMALLGWLFYRDNPEECGLVMDGKASDPTGEADPPIPALSGSSPDPVDPERLPHRSAPRNFTRSEALRTLMFWAVTLALASQALAVTGITFHIVDIGAAAGLNRTQAVSIFFPIAVFSTIAGYGVGMLADRVPLKLLFIGMMGFEALGLLGIAHLDQWLPRIVAMAGIGITGGCFGTLSTVAMPRYFGRRHLGAIGGVEMMTLVMASALGPSLLAAFRLGLGSYQPGLYVCGILPLLVIGLLVGARDPQQLEETSD